MGITALIFRTSMLLLSCLLLAACSSAPKQSAPKSQLAKWLSQAVIYQQNLGPEHPDSAEQMVSLTPQMRAMIEEKFGHLQTRKKARALATWLLDADGRNMKYDTHANFAPIDAFRERRGNCLSFTILLTSMANELGVSLQYNEVDMPDAWELNEESNGMMLYRHVNAIYETPSLQLVFDLALSNYDSRYPQRVIEEYQAVAMLHNNLSMEALLKADYETSFHRMKLSLATDPDNADAWGNLGVLFKRTGNLHLAEQAFLYALDVNRANGAAASNLERVYRDAGKTQLAAKYERMARSARLSNPYYHYKIAERAFLDREFKPAKKAIKKAKYLHDKDSRFFVLSSQIEQQLKNYKAALRDLQEAFKLSNNNDERGRFVAKAEMVGKLMEEQARQRQQNSRGRQIEIIGGRRGY